MQASVAAALSRDVVFGRTAPATYALNSLLKNDKCVDFFNYGICLMICHLPTDSHKFLVDFSIDLRKVLNQ